MSTFPQPASDTAEHEALYVQIAQCELRIPTLRTRNSDNLDFHDLSVWQILAALQRAYAEGRASALLQQQEGENA